MEPVQRKISKKNYDNKETYRKKGEKGEYVSIKMKRQKQNQKRKKKEKKSKHSK